MSRLRLRSAGAALAVLAWCGQGIAQDVTPAGGEPVIASIDPANLAYDFLVDGDLGQDEPAARRFQTVQAAYAAAPEGTAEKPTIIGIKPNVYLLPGGAPRTPSLSIRKNYITFLGLTNNRRSVVLADNRGLMQGAEDNGYILDVNATGFSLRNLTVLNFCNTDYAYPGNPAKNLRKRSDVITQAVALQAAGDKHVYENVALLSRLDTMFLRTTRSYFKNVYIEGTDDWVGGGRISVWEDCTLVYPTGRGVMSASNIVFLRCRFEASRGMQWYKAEFRGAERPDALIDCVVPVSAPSAIVAWIRGRAAPRPAQYSLTYHVKDAAGNPARIVDATVGPATYTYGRELSDREVEAYNPWNLLRAAPGLLPDNWDPAGMRAQYEKTGEGVFRMEVSGGSPTLRTGGAGATLSATVMPADAADQTVHWSTSSPLVALSADAGAAVTVTARNATDQAEWVAVKASAANGFAVTAYVRSEPAYIAPPRFTAVPTVATPQGGFVHVRYALDATTRVDESSVTWFACDDAAGTNPRPVAVSRGDEPLKDLRLTPALIGKYVKVVVQPKYSISEPGPSAESVMPQPIRRDDVPGTTISPNFRNFVTATHEAVATGWWTVLGTWVAVPGENYANGWGIRPTTPGALLFAGPDCDDMQVELVMSPEKTEGMGFSIPGSPADSGERNLHADVYIKYDARTKSGYGVRFWRTTQSSTKCRFQLYRFDHGAGTPLNDTQVLSGVFKPTTHMTLEVKGTRLTVTASNDVDQESLRLDGEIPPTRAGGAGVSWPRGSTNVYSRFEISYPNAPRP